MTTTASETEAETASETANPYPDSPRITSVGQKTWIFKRREKNEDDFLGYVRQGRSIAVKSLDTVPGINCPGGFYEAQPRGYICKDRTVAAEAPTLFAAVDRETLPARRGMPYRYALSDGAPMYQRVPTADEILKNELYLGKPHEFAPLFPTLHSHEELAITDAITASHPLPSFLQGGRALREDPFDLVARTIPRGSMLSYAESFEVDGRVYLLSTDHTLVPADRVRAFRPSAFHGTRLGQGGASLPIAWMRVNAKKKYARAADGTMHTTGEEWPVRSFVEITGSIVSADKKQYLETRERGTDGPLFMAEGDATVVERATERAFGVKPGQKWIAISITRGTLVAYEDLEPVYATLISPGAGGVPTKGHDPVKDSTTPIGSFTITFKDRASTMSPDKGEDDRTFWIADVPYTQYFNAPFALHAAFWHERFGELVSAGCVNLSPIDAEIMFGWTDPPVPEEWQGATAAGAPENGASTIVVVRR